MATLEPPTLVRLRIRNFKALAQFTVRLSDRNVLVGPNNSGKSTILGLFRTLDVGLRRGRLMRGERVETPVGRARGYRLSTDRLGFPLENVRTNYVPDRDPSATFTLSNGNTLTFHFSEDDCVMTAEADGVTVDTAAGFKKAFPLNVVSIPVLGPVEHHEMPVSEETVQANLTTHRASRNFRSYWYRYPEKFEEFRTLLRTSWPGMDIRAPAADGSQLTMMFYEGGANAGPRELFWSGFGFQIWCQLLTHLVRANDSDIVVIDEPETYLHPDLQRHFVSILRETNAVPVVATHSGEIISECDPGELTLIDKSRKTSRRVSSGATGVQSALASIGSRSGVALTRLARSRRALFVEGEDFKLLRRVAGRAGMKALAGTADITDLDLGGHNPNSAVSTLRGIRLAIGADVRGGLILDRDYRPDEEVDAIRSRYRSEFSMMHVFKRKEIENYFLDPAVIQRVVDAELKNQAARSKKGLATFGVSEALMEITSELKNDTESQILARARDYARGEASHLDESAVFSPALKRFEERWSSLDGRLALVSGKKVIADLNDRLQEVSVSVSAFRIIDGYESDEIPMELVDLLRDLDRFRRSTGY